MNRSLKRVLWFIGLWAAGVVTVLLVARALRFAMGMG